MQLHVLVRSGTEQLAERGYRVTPALLAGTGDPPSGGSSGTGQGGEELLQRTRALYQAMMAEVEAVQALGVEVKGVEHGLVDFQSWLDGESEVLLCWKLGEKKVEHYHLPDAGFAGRQSVQGHVFSKEPRASQEATRGSS